MADTATEARTSSGTLTQLFVGLVWLGVTFFTAHATIKGNAEDVSVALGTAAAALPGVIAATLLTGASIGQAAGSRFPATLRRLLAGAGLGLIFGAAAALAIRYAYGDTSSITVLAVTVGVASVVGGASAVLPRPGLAAALWATTWVFVAGLIVGVLQSNLMGLLGGGPDASLAAQADAAKLIAYGQSILTGLVAGLIAFRSLRRAGRAWPWFLVAGAYPGLLLLAAEVLTRVGGSSLLNLVKSFSPGDAAVLTFTDWARLRHALIVAFVGGFIAMIEVGRTIGRAPGSERDDDSTDPDTVDASDSGSADD